MSFSSVSASILAIGDELLDGARSDLHTRWIAETLKPVGIEIKSALLVRDRESAISQALSVLSNTLTSERPALLIITGGLGPTSDDLTTEVLARTFGWTLVPHGPSLQHIRKLFEKRKIPFGVGQEKQCLLPEGARVLANTTGTAPGYIKENQGLWVVVLPGPPHELHPMFLNEVVPFLKQKFSLEPLEERVLQVYETPESLIASTIQEEDQEIQSLLSQGFAIRISYREKVPRVYVKTVWSGKSLSAKAEQLFTKIKEKCARFPTLESSAENLEQLVIEAAIAKKKTIACAESCTGGMLSMRLTNISGASAVIRQNVVTYSDEAKTQLLGVSRETLKKHGAVSEQVACEMAKGAAVQVQADLGLSITGIAGPTGGTPEKPVGTVCMALYSQQNQQLTSWTFHFRGDRERVRLASTEWALWKLWQAVQAH